MNKFFKNLLTREGLITLALLGSGLMLIAGLSSGAPFLRMVAVVGLFNFILSYWYTKRYEG